MTLIPLACRSTTVFERVGQPSGRASDSESRCSGFESCSGAVLRTKT